MKWKAAALGSAAAAILTALFLPIMPRVVADMGGVPADPNAKIFEPVQRAIIAWNGKTEILLLSVDMKASVETKVLQILPLPAEPKVKKGSLDSFKAANKLIEAHYSSSASLGGGGESGKQSPAKGPPAEITFHEKIGAHDISVAKVLDQRRFTGWVAEFAKKNGMGGLQVPTQYLHLVDAYLVDGISWFVLDVVDLKTEERTLYPIQYTFACDHLYYPLRISSPEDGDTHIRLIILTPKLLSKFRGLPKSLVRLEHEPFTIEPSQTKDISPDMAAILEGTKPYLRIWNCKGALQSFKKDLLVYE